MKPMGRRIWKYWPASGPVFWTPTGVQSQKYLKNGWRYQNVTTEINYWEFKDLQIGFHTSFRYLKRFLRYFEKTVFEKTLSDATVSWNVLTWVKLRCFFIFYLHVNGSIGIVQKNRLRDKSGFGMYNPQNIEKSGFGQSVCVSVCLAVAFRASSHRRKVKPIELKL